MNKILRYSLMAVLAVIGFGNAMADTTDELTATSFGIPTVESAAYADFIASGTSGAAYAVQAYGKQAYIQIRSNNNNSGVIVTTSAGYVKSISITYNSEKTGDKAGEIDVYAKDAAYSTPADLYGDNKGTKVGQITASKTTYEFTKGYQFFGIRSTNGARYIDQITVVWTDEAPSGGDDPGTPDPTNIETVANIAAFKALQSGTEAKLTLTNATVLYAKGKDIYVKDETGAIDFYDTGLTSLTTGKSVSGTVIGKYAPYNNLPEFVKTDYTNENNLTVSDGTATATELTVAGVTDTYLCDLVKLTNVKVAQREENERTNNYAIDGSDEVLFYNKFNVTNALTAINAENPDNTYDIEGIVVYSGSKLAIAITKAVAVNTETGEAYTFVGDGTKASPYTVEDVRHMTELPTEKAWVKGIIVGSASSATQLKAEGADVASNIAIAESATETTKFIPVELKANSEFRTKLNVADNASNKGQEVLLYGQITTYFSTTGVKDLAEAVFNSETISAGISALTATQQKNAAAYNLKGQRVNQGYKGLVIKGGVKMIQK